MTDLFVAIAALIVATLSSARLTRLITQDSFPPVAWIRGKWDDLTEHGRLSGWNVLLHCHFCFSFWATAAVVGWLYLTWKFGGEAAWTVWFLLNGTLAMSYIAAMIVHRDEAGD